MASIREQFRATREQCLTEADAGRKPLSSGDKASDRRHVAEMAEQIAALQEKLYAQGRHKLLVVLQGMDTSGKDGTIRDVFSGIDPLGITSTSFKLPTADEKAHDYLWRIHQKVPMQGQVAVFNRSHYEDVLVTLVHGDIDEAECARRYAQIRDFERMLSETGTTILKCFLHISRDEQRERLQARLDNPEKHWKFDMQDVKERAHWDAYQAAYEQAIRHTSTDYAPWYVIPADSKTHRNLAVASIVLEALDELHPAYPPPHLDYAKLRID